MIDEQQHKDNNNITKYLELNKDRILNLGEKNYENLVEVFANSATTSAVASSSNAKLSLPTSMTFKLGLYNKNNVYRKEQSDIYDDDQQYFDE